jgi:hypothetical protein
VSPERRRRGTAAAVAATLLALLLALAGCGGDGDDGDERAATVPGDAPITTPAGLAERLPDTGSVPGLGPADPQPLGSLSEVAGLFFPRGDARHEEAVRRLGSLGLEQAVARQQLGVDPNAGLAAMRTFVLRLGSARAARDEVEGEAAQVAEVPYVDLEEASVAGVPGARVLRTVSTRPGPASASVLVLVPKGPHVYGLQGFAPRARQIPEDEISALARAHAREVAP